MILKLPLNNKKLVTGFSFRYKLAITDLYVFVVVHSRRVAVFLTYWYGHGLQVYPLSEKLVEVD